MARWCLAGGISAGLVGVALIVPGIVGWLEKGTFQGPAIAMIAVGGALVVAGLAAAVVGVTRWRELTMPTGVRIAVMANIVFLACFALEISDGLARRGGAIHPIGWTMFGPTLVLLYGLLSARRWAWWIARGVAALVIVWFLGFAVIIPFADLRAEQVPVPWWGRIYMICVSLILAGMLSGGFFSLGGSPARNYFGLRAARV